MLGLETKFKIEIPGYMEVISVNMSPPNPETWVKLLNRRFVWSRASDTTASDVSADIL